MYILKLIVYTYSTVPWCAFFIKPYSVVTSQSRKFDEAQEINTILSIVHKPFSAVMK